MRVTFVALTSYLLGCFTAAYYLVRLRTGEDVRATGSGNPGARNVLRTRGIFDAALTLAVDAGKGALAVFIAARVWPPAAATGIAFLFVVAGHVWPVQLRFRGGKGAATAGGGLLAMSMLGLVGDSVAQMLLVAAGIGIVVAAHHPEFRRGLLSTPTQR